MWEVNKKLSQRKAWGLQAQPPGDPPHVRGPQGHLGGTHKFVLKRKGKRCPGRSPGEIRQELPGTFHPRSHGQPFALQAAVGQCVPSVANQRRPPELLCAGFLLASRCVGADHLATRRSTCWSVTGASGTQDTVKQDTPRTQGVHPRTRSAARPLCGAWGVQALHAFPAHAHGPSSEVPGSP